MPASTADSPPLSRVRALPFAAVLLIPFLLLVALPAALLGWFAVRSAEDAADDFGAQVLRGAVARAEDAVVDHLAKADSVLDALTLRPAAGAAAGAARMESLAAFETIAWHIGSAHAQPSLMYFGRPDGNYLQLERVADGSTRIGTAVDGAMTYYHASAPGERVFERASTRGKYDPRERPWYRLADARRERVWTAVYPSFARDFLVITRAEPVRDAAGGFGGVIGADLELERVSQTLTDLRISPGAVAFIIDGEGQMIATSTREPLFTKVGSEVRRLPPAQSRNALMREAARAIGALANRKDERPIRIDGPDGETRVSAHKVAVARGVDWTMVIAVPRADFIGGLNTRARAIGLSGAVALGFFALLWLWLARRILGDLGALRSFAGSIGREQPGEMPRPSRIREFGTLGAALAEMTRRLALSREQIAAQNLALAEANTALEARVAARTREIDSARHFYVSVLDNCPILVSVRDPQGKLLFANHAWARLNGVAREASIGKTRAEIGQQPATVADAADREALATPGAIIEDEITSGNGRILLYSRSALVDKGGRPTGVIVAGQDVTELRRAEQDVARERERLALTIEASRAAIGEWDLESGGVWWSTRLKELLGYPPDHVPDAATDISAYAHPDDRRPFMRAVGGMLRGGRRMDLELQLARKGGGHLWAHATGLAVKDDAGRVRRAVGSFTDISQRKAQERRLDDQRKFAADLVRLNPNPIFVKDTELRYTSVNPAWEQLTGISATAALGRTLQDLDPDAALANELEAADRSLLATGGSLVIETALVRRDGSQREVIMSRSALTRTDGSCFGIIGGLTDITELKASREEALAAAQAKAAFLATMSHEIRTPMNGVIGMTGLLAETALSPQQRDFVDTIRVSGDQLLAVINDILDFSKIESDRMGLESEPLSLVRMVEESIEMVAERARAKQLELLYQFDPGVPAAIHGDITRLRQVIVNLVGNAVKFTETGEVLVSVHLLQPETADAPALIEFRVKDSGIGIPPDRIGALFQAFTQVDTSTTRKYGGTGLGLVICKRLIALMGGSIDVDSTPGHGTTFRFTIRARGAPELPLPTVDIAHAGLAGRRVLLVDDNPTNLRVLSGLLANWGLSTESVNGGAAALRRLAEGARYDLAILDMQMPEMDGLTLAAAIRQTAAKVPAGTPMPMILLSSVPLDGNADPERLFGARLLKPLRQVPLFEAIGAALDARHAAPAAATGPSITARSLASGTPLAILVADDNAVNRKIAALMIGRSGYAVDSACDGNEAVDLTARAATAGKPYDIVFMDVHMPKLDGFAATRAIAAGHGAARPRIIAMTASAMQGDREACLAAGMDDYLSKPLDITAVEAALVKWGAICAALPRAAGTPPPPPSALALAPPPGAAPTQVSTSATGIINRARLDEFREYDDADGSLVKDMIALYLRDGAERLAEIRRSFDAGESESLMKAAHALKGGASNIGADAIADLCKTIEQCARDGTPGAAAGAVAALPAAFDAARDALQAG